MKNLSYFSSGRYIVKSISTAVGTSKEWRFECPQGTQSGVSAIRIKPRLNVTTNDAAIKAALQGFGITRILSYQVADYLVSGQLKILLENYEPAVRPVHIVHREGRLPSTKVRAFIDLMAERLRKDKALN